MSITLEKFQLTVLNTQFGKTFESMKDLDQTFALDKAEEANAMTIVYTQNSLLSNAQFTSRLRRMQELRGNGSVCIIASQSKPGWSKFTFSNCGKLAVHILDKAIIMPRVVVACSNCFRFDEIEKLIRLFTLMPSIRAINLVFDEIHAYIDQRKGSLRNIIKECNGNDKVSSITGLTATPAPIFHDSPESDWFRLRLRKLSEFNDENYYYLKDMVFIDHTPDCQVICNYEFPTYIRNAELNGNINRVKPVFAYADTLFLEHPEILEEYEPCSPPRVLLLAHLHKVSHYMMCELVWSRNSEALVVVLNGDDKCVFYKDNRVEGGIGNIPLSSKEPEFQERYSGKELCEVLAQELKSHNLLHKPLVFTGKVCLGMGQTLCHETYGNFTDVIISDDRWRNETLYQAVGRSNARCTHWKTFRPTRIYTTPLLYDNCLAMEDRSKNVAMTFSTQEGRCITKMEYEEATDLDSCDLNPTVPKVTRERVLVSDDQYRVYTGENALKIANEAIKFMGYKTEKGSNAKIMNKAAGPDGFIKASIIGAAKVLSLSDAINIGVKNSKQSFSYAKDAQGNKILDSEGKPKMKTGARHGYPCYLDVNDVSSLSYVIVIRSPETEFEPRTKEEVDARLRELDERYPPYKTSSVE